MRSLALAVVMAVAGSTAALAGMGGLWTTTPSYPDYGKYYQLQTRQPSVAQRTDAPKAHVKKTIRPRHRAQAHRD